MLLSSERDESGFAKTFPQKLMELLSYDDVRESITWMPKGDAIMIINEGLFEEKVLPRFFKKTKFSSFKGKLYRWGFKRVMKGENAGGYFQKLFIRDNPILCLHMRRSVKKDNGDIQTTADTIVSLKCKRNRISDISNLRSNRQVTTHAFETNRHKTKVTIPKLPNQIFSTDSQVTCKDGYYNHTLLLTQLARELVCKEIALRTQIQAQSIEKLSDSNPIEKYFDSVGNLSEQHFAYSHSFVNLSQNPKLGIAPSKKNISLSRETRNERISSSGDKKYFAALAGLLNLQNNSL